MAELTERLEAAIASGEDRALEAERTAREAGHEVRRLREAAEAASGELVASRAACRAAEETAEKRGAELRRAQQVRGPEAVST